MNEPMFVTLILIFARTATFLFRLPMLSSRYIHPIVKITIATGISVGILNRVDYLRVDDLVTFVGLIVIQILIGLTLAYVVELIFASVRIAGGLLDMDLGFIAAQVVDPSTNQHVTVLSNILFIFFFVSFVQLGGLNAMIAMIAYSFEFMTPGDYGGDVDFLAFIMQVFMYMFTMALQMSLPITGSMLAINLVMLIIGKNSPQLNVFNNVFIVKIAVGLVLFGLTLPYFGEVFSFLNEAMLEKMIEAMEIMFKEGE